MRYSRSSRNKRNRAFSRGCWSHAIEANHDTAGASLLPINNGSAEGNGFSHVGLLFLIVILAAVGLGMAFH